MGEIAKAPEERYKMEVKRRVGDALKKSVPPETKPVGQSLIQSVARRGFEPLLPG